jgi:predicted GNAT family acetyltransferase
MIRAATRVDIPNIVRCNLTAKTSEETIGYAPPLEQRTFADQNKLERVWGSGNQVKGGFVYVFEENEEVVAYVLIEVQPDAIEIDNMDVTKNMRGKGIGKALVKFVKDLAREQGKKYVTLGTSRNQKTGKPWRSYGFWMRMGYSEDGEIQMRADKMASLRFGS